MDVISIIVPVYNTEQYLKKCIDSLIAQDYKEKEIILVDDQSTDNSGRICDEYAKKHENVHVLHVDNGGPNRACYMGLKISRGDYICFCDSDDWVEPDMLSQMAKYMKSTPEQKQIICCNYVIEKENGKKKYCVHGAEPGIYAGQDLEVRIKERVIGYENRVVSMSRCMKLFSRELLEENIELWDYTLRMGDDMTIVIPAICDADEIVIMKEAYFYHYRFLTSSLVHKYDVGLYENIKRLKDKLTSILERKRKQFIYDISIEREYLYLLMLVLKNEIRGNANHYKNIIEICEREKTKRKIRQYGMETSELANKLCKMVLKNPNYITISGLFFAMKLYERIK